MLSDLKQNYSSDTPLLPGAMDNHCVTKGDILNGSLD